MGKLSNDEIYQKLMESRKNDPKRYACNTIAVIYDELKKRLDDRTKFRNGEITSKRFNPITAKEVHELKIAIRQTVVRMVENYGITQQDVDNYNTTAVGKLCISLGESGSMDSIRLWGFYAN